ncbi:MAG: FAD-dependent oxidoreductase [Solirubrobacteraceae bacterium]
MSGPAERVDVAIIGAGPAGLAAAAELRRLTGASVLVVERELEAGGIPRHAHHGGYGLRDLHTSLSGPRYARRWTERARRAGAQLRLGTQVTGWAPDGALRLTAPSGATRVQADAVILATGCRERPRSARLVAGSRPQGVITTGTLQQLVNLAGESPGRRAVIVGAEHVSFSALATLAHAGAEAVAMTTELPRHQSYALFRAGAALRYRTPLLTRTAVTAVHGRRRVEGVQLTDLDTGHVSSLACDTVVFTADWVPDHELAVAAGADLDPATAGPRVDGALRTTRPGLFAAGNILHGAETADVAALAGRHCARAVRDHLRGAPWPAAPVPLVCEAPLHWITPGAVEAHARPPAPPPRGRYLLRAREELLDARIALVQDGRELTRQRLVRVTAGRSAALTPAWADAVDGHGGPVLARVLAARRR